MLSIRQNTPQNILPDFDYSDILLDIVVCKAVALVKRYRTHRQGKPSGALAKLHQRGFRTPLPSIYLAKLHSLPNKTDKLLLLSQTNKDLSNSAALFSHVKTPYIIVCIAYCVLPFCTLPICTFVYCYFVVCILLLSFCCTVELLSLLQIPCICKHTWPIKLILILIQWAEDQ